MKKFIQLSWKSSALFFLISVIGCQTTPSKIDRHINNPKVISSQSEIKSLLEGSNAVEKCIYAGYSPDSPHFWSLKKAPPGTPIESTINSSEYHYSAVSFTGDKLHFIANSTIHSIDPEKKRAPVHGTIHTKEIAPIKSLDMSKLTILPQSNSASSEYQSKVWTVIARTKSDRPTCSSTEDGKTLKFPFFLVRFQTEEKARKFVSSLHALILAIGE